VVAAAGAHMIVPARNMAKSNRLALGCPDTLHLDAHVVRTPRCWRRAQRRQQAQSGRKHILSSRLAQIPLTEIRRSDVLEWLGQLEVKQVDLGTTSSEPPAGRCTRSLSPAQAKVPRMPA
jgi:hypothetical protein